MRAPTRSVVVVASIAALLQACAGGALPGKPPVVAECSTPTSGDRPGPALVGQAYGMAITPMPLNSVQFASVDTSRMLAVQSLFAERTATGTVEVSARFVSCLDQPAAVLVRTSFLRAGTAPAEAPTAWKTVYLQPRATALYSELSTSLDAAHYLIEVAK